MHPNRAFDWDDEAAMLAFVGNRAFATIALPAPGVVHAPLTVDGRTIRFHVARRNRMIDAIDGRRIVASVMGEHAYHSANWYASDNQVPTWLYEVVELEGVARRIDEQALADQVIALSDRMETIYQPDRPWTHDKMAPGSFEAMLKAIAGFEFTIDALRGTRKYTQHKSAADIAASIAGQRESGNGAMASRMEEFRA